VRAIGLVELVRYLDRQNTASFQGPMVDAYLNGNTVELNDILPFTRFREDTYARNLVRRTEQYEILVLAWLGGQRAGIHNHSGQKCWTQVLSGELCFQNYGPLKNLNECPSRLGAPLRQSAGSVTYIDDHEGVHSIANEGNVPAISLHIYASPVTHCWVYFEKESCFKQIELQSFPPPFEMEEMPALPSAPESPEW
jgi:predicted metal-dependent enzyme (double-stranded beta helix superfamily)